MNNGDKVEIYAADNRWHECTYIGKSPNKGHYIIFKDGKPYECSFIRKVKGEKINER